MNRRRPSFIVCAGLLGLAVVGSEAWWLHRCRSEAVRAWVAFAQKKQERDGLALLVPAPRPENEVYIAAELAAMQQRLANLRHELNAGTAEPIEAAPPGSPLDAFFALAGFVEQARGRANASGVTVRSEESFGFSAYSREGPPADLLEAVHRQQHAVRSLLDSLFASGPMALLGVRRTAPSVGRAEGRDEAHDFFTLDPGLSLREKGRVDTVPVRIEFTGQTSTLRTFLTGLATHPHPVIVRSIEVESLAPTEATRPATAPTPAVIAPSLSRFAVIVEFMLWPPGAGDPSP